MNKLLDHVMQVKTIKKTQKNKKQYADLNKWFNILSKTCLRRLKQLRNEQYTHVH